MALILHIDTSMNSGSVCLSDESKIILLEKNEHLFEHAAWLQPTIKKMLSLAKIKISKLQAVSVSIGPGSYTGLRVGLSSAKGICFALKIPLITIGTLEMMTHSALHENKDLLCPMIDARRMEVYTAVYNKKIEPVKAPAAMFIDSKSFSELLQSHSILFFGNGHQKFQNICTSHNASFKNIVTDATHLVNPSLIKFHHNVFADLVYSEPFYLKEFYSVVH